MPAFLPHRPHKPDFARYSRTSANDCICSSEEDGYAATPKDAVMVNTLPLLKIGGVNKHAVTCPVPVAIVYCFKAVEVNLCLGIRRYIPRVTR